MAQFARPDSDVSFGWDVGSPDNTNRYNNIDEVTLDTGDYIYESNNPNGVYEVGLSNITDPVSPSGHTIRFHVFQMDSDGGGPTVEDTGGTAVLIGWSLLQGASVIASNSINLSTGNGKNFAYTLSGAEADTITDYTDLRLSFNLSGGGGAPNSRRGATLFWAEFEVPDASQSYQLNASPNQSFTESGINTGLLASRNLDSSPQQTFTLTGASNIFQLTRKLNATPQQGFNLTGIATDFKSSYKLDSTPQQAFALSGIAIGLIALRNLDATPQQTFALTGNTTNFLRSLRLDGSPQQIFVLTGIDVNLDYFTGYTLTCDLGVFNLTGVVSDFLRGYSLNSSPQQIFTLTGMDTGLLISRTLDAVPQQTFALSGIDSGFLISRYLNAEPQQTFTFTGIDVILTYAGGYTFDCALGTFSLSMKDGDLLVSRILSGDPQSYSLIGNVTDLSKGFKLNAIVDSFALTGLNIGLNKTNELTVNVGNFILTGNNIGLDYSTEEGYFWIYDISVHNHGLSKMGLHNYSKITNNIEKYIDLSLMFRGD